MANKGIAPLDPTTTLGQVRGLIGATISVPFDPDQPGYADYEWFSDDEINGLLTVASDSPLRAAGFALLQMSNASALLAVDMQTEDLKAKTIQRSTDQRLLAESYFAQADAADANDYFFEVVCPVWTNAF